MTPARDSLPSPVLHLLLRRRADYLRRWCPLPDGRRLSREAAARQALAEVEQTLVAVKSSPAGPQFLAWAAEAVTGEAKERRRLRVKRVRRVRVSARAAANNRTFLKQLEMVA
jgi:hypothetical protein